jgi:hypothetical protein
MAFLPEQSAIKVDAELEAALKNASHDQIKSIMADAAVRQGLATRDFYDPSIILPTEGTAAPQKFARAVVINGVKHVVEANSPVELEKAEAALYRQALTPTETQQPRDSVGKFVSQEDANKTAQDELFRRSELELRFKRGELSAADYLEQSGAIETFLANQGISIEDLQATTEEKQATKIRQSWEEATEAFLNSPEGQDWPGGQDNLTRIGNLLQKMDATEEPSVENLAIAYKWLRDNNQLVPNPETETQSKIANARTPQEIREALGRGSSSLFGGR